MKLHPSVQQAAVKVLAKTQHFMNKRWQPLDLLVITFILNGLKDVNFTVSLQIVLFDQKFRVSDLPQKRSSSYKISILLLKWHFSPKISAFEQIKSLVLEKRPQFINF